MYIGIFPREEFDVNFVLVKLVTRERQREREREEICQREVQEGSKITFSNFASLNDIIVHHFCMVGSTERGSFRKSSARARAKQFHRNGKFYRHVFIKTGSRVSENERFRCPWPVYRFQAAFRFNFIEEQGGARLSIARDPSFLISIHSVLPPLLNSRIIIINFLSVLGLSALAYQARETHGESFRRTREDTNRANQLRK